MVTLQVGQGIATDCPLSLTTALIVFYIIL